MHTSSVIILAATLTLVGCSGSSVVTITNRSSVVLSNVVVSGSGFTNLLEIIAAGTEQHIVVHPRGESGLRAFFDAAGQRIDSGEQGYLEAQGYRVSAVIATNLSISISSGL